MRTLLTIAALMLLPILAGAASAALFGPDAPDAHWLEHAERMDRPLDNAGWRDFLARHLDTDHHDGIHRVRYGQVTETQRARLQRWIAAQAERSPTRMTRAQQMAYWINLYNALTVQLVLDHPGIASIRDIGGLFRPGPWARELIEIDGRALTLDDIEHRILRPVFDDPRVHFAVNCASLGCPNLAAEPFEAASLDSQLEAGARSYVRHPRGLSFDAGGTLQLSSIFDWYRDDFPEGRQPFMAWLADYAGDEAAGRLQGYRGPIEHAYDWTLNAP